MTIDDIGALRRDYRGRSLLESEVSAHPLQQFRLWFQEAQKADVLEPNAMSLCTVAPNGVPSVRIVLLKGIRDTQFIFFTNYRSQKAQEIEHTGQAALCFWWAELERQVRVQGTVARISPQESSEYFASRPRGSQIGAWASDQSSVLADRQQLANAVRARETQFGGNDIPRPEHWGGFAVSPVVIEFWQGQSNRLHDRLRYTLLDSTGTAVEPSWRLERLAP